MLHMALQEIDLDSLVNVIQMEHLCEKLQRIRYDSNPEPVQ